MLVREGHVAQHPEYASRIVSQESIVWDLFEVASTNVCFVTRRVNRNS